MQNNSAAKAIQKLKSIKIEYYELGILNFTLFVAVFLKELPILYIIGTFIFIRLAYAFIIHSVLKISKATDENPVHMISTQAQKTLTELKMQTNGVIQGVGEMMSGDNSINTIIYVLVALYFSTNFLPASLEVILLCNFLFIWMFMREAMFCWLENAKTLPKIWKS